MELVEEGELGVQKEFDESGGGLSSVKHDRSLTNWSNSFRSLSGLEGGSTYDLLRNKVSTLSKGTLCVSGCTREEE